MIKYIIRLIFTRSRVRSRRVQKMNKNVQVFNSDSASKMETEQILANVGEGFTIIVKRIEPRWCDGIIDEFEIEKDERLSVMDFRDRYGGRKLNIRIVDGDGRTIANRNLKFAHPPKEDGRILENLGGERSPIKHPSSNWESQQQIQQPQQQIQQPGANDLTLKLLDLFSKRLDKLEIPQQPQQQMQEVNGFDQIKESIKTIKALEEMRATIHTPTNGESNDNSDMLSGLMEKYFELQMKKEDNSNNTQPQTQQQQPAPPLPERNQQNQQPQQNTNPLANVSDMELAAHAKQRFDKMDPLMQKKMLEVLIGQELEMQPEEEEEEEEERDDKETENSGKHDETVVSLNNGKQSTNPQSDNASRADGAQAAKIHN